MGRRERLHRVAAPARFLPSLPSRPVPGVPNDNARDVPDIALIASPRFPGAFWANNKMAPRRWPAVSAEPVYARRYGLDLRPSSEQMVNNNRLGNLNPIIYSLANSRYYTAGFHDVSIGNNGYNGVAGFNAGSGYDQSSGWGTIDFNLFANAVKTFLGASPTPVGSPTVTPTVTATPTRTVTPTPTATATPVSAISFVSAGALTDSSTAVTTVTLGAPGSIRSGDVLVAQLIVFDGTAANVPTAPSGWNAIRHDAVSNGNKATSWLYYKMAGSSEPASYGWSISSNWAAGVIGAWRSVAGSPIDVASGSTAGGNSPVTVSAPSLTPSHTGEMQLFFYGSQSSSAPAIALSSSLSQRFNKPSSKEGFTLAFADHVAPFMSTASPVYPATVSISGSPVVTAQTILLITGSGATPTPTPTTAATPTITRTATSTPTRTATMTATATFAPTSTATATIPAVLTPTATPTGTATTTATAIATPTATATPISAGISFEGNGALTDSSSTVTSITLSLPSGIRSGDIMVAQVVVFDGSASDVATLPSGWTSIRHDAVSSGNKLTSWLYYKVAGSSEPSSYKWSLSSNWAAGVIGAWRGASGSPIDGSSGAVAAGSSSASVSAPSLTPHGNKELQIYFYGAQSSSAPVVTLSNALTQRSNNKSSKEGFTLAYGDLAAPSSGTASPTYPATASLSTGAAMTGQAVLLVPAAQ